MNEPDENRLLDVFQRIYVINLASRDDRRREMEQQLRRIGLSLGARNVELFEAVRPEEAAGFPSIGARGCFLSHLGVLKRAAASKLQTILILEDDLNFVDDFSEKMGAVAQRLKRLDWSLFYGGYRAERAPVAEALGCAQPLPDEAVGTSHFVGIHGGAIGSLVSYLEAQLARPSGDALGGPMHVDGSYTWFRRAHPELGTLLAVPQLGYQRSSRTDVHALGWGDRAWGVRGIASILRKLKNG